MEYHHLTYVNTYGKCYTQCMESLDMKLNKLLLHLLLEATINLKGQHFQYTLYIYIYI